MVAKPEKCARCGTLLRRQSDPIAVCSVCAVADNVTQGMGSDEMRAPVLVERPGMFRSWSALLLFFGFLFGAGVCIAALVWYLLRA